VSYSDLGLGGTVVGTQCRILGAIRIVITLTLILTLKHDTYPDPILTLLTLISLLNPTNPY